MTDLGVVSRTAWGARYRAGFGVRQLPASESWLHHSVTATLPVDAALAQEYTAMRSVEQIGQTRFGAGFPYNLAVFPSGRVYEGCGVERVGAHTAGRNILALGIVLMGNFDTHPMPAPMRAVLPELLREAHRRGWLNRPRFDGGHRDAPGASTACPGRYAYAQIAAINAEAAPPLPAPAPFEEDDMAARIKKASGDQQWLVSAATGAVEIETIEEAQGWVRTGLVPAADPLVLPDEEVDALIAAAARR